MCTTCGCGHDEPVVYSPDGAEPPHHHHNHTHNRAHDHGPPTETVTLEQKVLAKNDAIAERNRDWLIRRGVLALNLTSSPGAGKTTLLERSVRELSAQRPVCVIEGDQETVLDAERIRAAGARAVQVNTGAGCHLDADMVRRALDELEPEIGSVVFIENVGNLVCPAMFDLGEAAKVVVVSVTEGADKPLKYPHMFAAASLVVINKMDLLPYVDFDVDTCMAATRALNPSAQIVTLSATTGEGMASWYDWVARHDAGPRHGDAVAQAALS